MGTVGTGLHTGQAELPIRAGQGAVVAFESGCARAQARLRLAGRVVLAVADVLTLWAVPSLLALGLTAYTWVGAIASGDRMGMGNLGIDQNRANRDGDNWAEWGMSEEVEVPDKSTRAKYSELQFAGYHRSEEISQCMQRRKG